MCLLARQLDTNMNRKWVIVHRRHWGGGGGGGGGGGEEEEVNVACQESITLKQRSVQLQNIEINIGVGGLHGNQGY